MTPRGTIVVALAGVMTNTCAPVSAPAPVPQSELPRVAAPPPPTPLSRWRSASIEIEIEGPFVQGGIAKGWARGARQLILFGPRPNDPSSLPLNVFDNVSVAPDGRFLIAFDRDSPKQLTLAPKNESGHIRRLMIAPRAWRIENLSSLPRQSRPSAEFARLRPAELAEIGRARASDNETGGWRQRFVWPVTGRISGLFGAQRVYRGEPGAYHSGVDVARAGGTPFAAPADGVVVLATNRPFTLEGNLLIIDHGMGLNSAFLHLARIDVRAGDRVRQGQLLGAIGATGRATGPHLHWGMKWRDRRIDPLLLAGPMPAG